MIAISNSEITTWLRCKRQWYIKYYLQKDTKPAATGHLQLGSRVHTAMELYYGKGDDPITVLYRMYANLEMEWSQRIGEDYGNHGTDAEVLKDIRSEGELAVRMVEGYLEWVAETGADQDFEVIKTEDRVAVPLTDEITLKGRLDMIIRRHSDGAIMFLDHKTAPKLDMDPDLLQIDSQFRIYALILKLAGLGDPNALRVDGGIRSILKKVRRTAAAEPPFYRRYEVRHNDHELRATYAKVKAVGHEILRARRKLDDAGHHSEAAYPTPDLDCSWRCPFTGICISMDDGSRWQDQLDMQYIDADPYAHYSSEN
jgi:RecB family exonuclease